MKHIIPGWCHRPGVHCASTAISDTMTYRGHRLSEPMCFGLGAGLGFAYFESPALSPSRMTAVRSRLLESRFFSHLGWPFEWRTVADPETAMTIARQYLLAHTPLLLHADIRHLPHYNTKTHFPGHVIALWGFDDDTQTAFVSDTGWPGLLPVPYIDLNQARYDGTPFMKSQGDYFPVPPDQPLPHIQNAARRALRQQAKDLFGLQIDIPGVFGFDGMKKAEAALPEWETAPDWNWCARWFYQVIERRGTGGGAFRLLYSRFLDELSQMDPSFSALAPPAEMREIAAAWTQLALSLKEISERGHPSGFAAIARRLRSLREREENFFAAVLAGIPEE